MLSDTARKIRRILFNMNQYEPFEIDISEIAKYSIRSENQVKEAINDLVKQNELIWHKVNNTFQVVR